MPIKTKRKPSCACELLTCKGDKQATLEEPEPQPDSSFFYLLKECFVFLPVEMASPGLPEKL